MSEGMVNLQDMPLSFLCTTSCAIICASVCMTSCNMHAARLSCRLKRDCLLLNTTHQREGWRDLAKMMSWQWGASKFVEFFPPSNNTSIIFTLLLRHPPRISAPLRDSTLPPPGDFGLALSSHPHIHTHSLKEN